VLPGLALVGWGLILALGAGPFQRGMADMVAWLHRNRVDPAHFPGLRTLATEGGARALRLVGVAAIVGGAVLAARAGLAR
jgi:hypothetical protein